MIIKNKIRENDTGSKGKKRNTVFGIAATLLIVVGIYVVTQIIIPESNYNNAMQLVENGKYDEAIAAFEGMNGFKDSVTQIIEAKYQKAGALNTSGEHAEAYALYATIRGYKDADSLLVNDPDLAVEARKAELTTVGNLLTFGHYEQDNDTGNGKESIEWQVLDVKGDEVLLISKHTLDAQTYYTRFIDITWENCTLRTWLNETFLDEAFTEKEQACILTTNVDNSESQGYSGYTTDGGNNTQDKIFLLSYAEAWKYFETDSARISIPTQYAKAQEGGEHSDKWWLRSPGQYQCNAVYVLHKGSHLDNLVGRTRGIRPACWINLESEIFQSYVSTGAWE